MDRMEVPNVDWTLGEFQNWTLKFQDAIREQRKKIARIKNRNIYILKKRVAQMITDAKGDIYGGYVRDMILHDYYAKQFFDNVPIADHVFYDDESFCPETALRKSMPHDIDCFFHTVDDFAKFKNLLEKEQLRYVEKSNKDPKKYFKNLNVEENELRHVKLMITLKASLSGFMWSNLPLCVRNNDVIWLYARNEKTCILPTFTVDVMIPTRARPGLYPPFSNLDFECNALIHNRYGLSAMHGLTHYMSPLDSHYVVGKIIEDIVQKRARVAGYGGNNAHRVKSMLRKGWTVVGFNVEQVKSKQDDVCLICLENFDTSHAFKLKCCNGMYHINCLQTTINRPVTGMLATLTCIHCRREAYLSQDVHLVQDIVDAVNMAKNKCT